MKNHALYCKKCSELIGKLAILSDKNKRSKALLCIQCAEVKKK